MPRTARLLLSATPHHVVQRGHNRTTVFAGDADYRYYLDTLIEWKTELEIKLYAFCLMSNHVHLILQPGNDTRTVGLLMRRLAGRQTRRVNAREGRTGTLWSGRYKASPIETDTYLLACSRYVELNPVRAGMVRTPADYPWSSYRHKTAGVWPDWLDEDPCYRALGSQPATRASRYRQFVVTDTSPAEHALIRHAVNRNQLTGDRDFIAEVETRVSRRVELRGPGRPPLAQARVK